MSVETHDEDRTFNQAIIYRRIRSELPKIERLLKYSFDSIWECLEDYHERYDKYDKFMKRFEAAIGNREKRPDYIHSLILRQKTYARVADKMIKKCQEYIDVMEKNALEPKTSKKKKLPKLIRKNNFFHPEDGIADFAGIRILHVKQGDWEKIHEFLTSPGFQDKLPGVRLNWKMAYARDEKDKEQYKKYFDEKNEITSTKEGYASLHYVFKDTYHTGQLQDSGNLARDLCLECQVRTVFDEGWGEISHEIDYPHGGHKIYQGHLSVLNKTTAAANEVTAALEALQGLPLFIPWETEQQLERSSEEVHCLTPSLEWVDKNLPKWVDNCKYSAGKAFYYVIPGHPEIKARIKKLNRTIERNDLKDRVRLFELKETAVPYPVISDVLWLHNAIDPNDPETSSERDLAVVGGPPPPSGRAEEQLDMLITDDDMIKHLGSYFKTRQREYDPKGVS